MYTVMNMENLMRAIVFLFVLFICCNLFAYFAWKSENTPNFVLPQPLHTEGVGQIG